MGHIEGIWRRLVVLQRATPRRSVQPRHVAVVVVRCDFKSDGLLLLLLLRRSAASPAAAPFLSEAEDGSRSLVVVDFIVAANAAAVIWASMLWSRSISLSSAAEDEDGEQND